MLDRKKQPSISSSLMLQKQSGLLGVFSPLICIFIAGLGLFIQTTNAQHSPVSALFPQALVLVPSGISKKGISCSSALSIFCSSWNTYEAPSLC